MRAGLTSHGIVELKTPDPVDAWGAETKSGILVIHSLCAGAAGTGRPGRAIPRVDGGTTEVARGGATASVARRRAPAGLVAL